jgi:hypothetical protein
MEKLDNLVAGHVEDRLLQSERLEEILASVLDRRQERAERRRKHIAELTKRAAETDLRLKRLYDAIENGVADLDDPTLKDRIAGLKSIRDQARPMSTAPRRWPKARDSRLSRPPWSKSSPVPPVSASGSTAAGIAASIFAHLPSESRWRTARFASWDRKAIYSKPLPPAQAQNGLRPAFAVLF